MTPKDLALTLTPPIQQAAEWAKADILKGLTPIQRVFAKAFWGMAMKEGVPIFTEITIEFMIARYRTDLEPTIGGIVNSLVQSMDEEKVPQLQLLRDILDVLQTPTTQFHPAVQAVLGTPNQGT